MAKILLLLQREREFPAIVVVNANIKVKMMSFYFYTRNIDNTLVYHLNFILANSLKVNLI